MISNGAFHETRASVTLELEREYEDMVKTLRQDAPTRQGIGFVQLKQGG